MLVCAPRRGARARPATSPARCNRARTLASARGRQRGRSATAVPDGAAGFDPKQLFANVCGWCHSSGGREAGKGPKLMGTTLTDNEIVYRIKMGKTGQMPAFGSALNDQQIAAVVAYIRNLKPEGSQ